MNDEFPNCKIRELLKVGRKDVDKEDEDSLRQFLDRSLQFCLDLKKK